MKPNRRAIKALDELCEGRKRAPSLKQLADFINEWLPELEARVERITESTDRKYRGSRIRWPGAGRTGNRVLVYEKSDRTRPIKEHNGAETYRHNGEFVHWIADQIGHKKGWELERRWVNW